MKNLDDLFEEGLGNYTETPPPAAWSAFEKKLGAVPHRGSRFSYRRLLLLAVAGLFVISIPAMKFLPVFNSVGDNGSATIATNIVDNTTGSNRSISEPATTNTAGNNTIDQSAPNDSDDEHNERSVNKTIAQNAKTNKSIPNRNNNALASKNANGHITNTEDNESEENITYRSNLSKPAPVDEPAENKQDNNNNELAAKPKEETAPAKAEQKPVVNVAEKNVPKPPKPKYNKWEAGVKAGYELGFDNNAAKKLVVSPYIQYNISRKFSIMLQPAIKGGQLANRRIGTPKSYYKVNDDSSITRHIDSNVFVPGGGLMYIVKDTFTQSHDSIVKTYSIGGKYFEIETPLMLKYNISKKFSVYGGVNIVYSQAVAVKESTYTSEPITRTVGAKPILRQYGVAPPPPNSVNSEITYTGTSISDYNGPAYKGSDASTLRAGYMAGLSFEVTNRVLFDLLVQQAKTRPNLQAGYNVNTTLSAPYVRFTIGYKLTK
ncbi:MAG: hypothetical protein K0Q79_2140 [Flavipsychrobacter sp.]|nr:hypothetical protein [Flavipsychrobacter sp.]